MQFEVGDLVTFTLNDINSLFLGFFIPICEVKHIYKDRVTLRFLEGKHLVGNATEIVVGAKGVRKLTVEEKAKFIARSL